MFIKSSIVLSIFIMLIACTEEGSQNTLSEPGFGIVETRISALENTTQIPVLLKTDELIKGLQFTLSWDTTLVTVGPPELNDLNASFTLKVGEGSLGKMKVLVFSMSGDALDTSEPAFMMLPVTLFDTQADVIDIFLNDVVFAGPQAASYSIPVTHAKLKVENS